MTSEDTWKMAWDAPPSTTWRYAGPMRSMASDPSDAVTPAAIVARPSASMRARASKRLPSSAAPIRQTPMATLMTSMKLVTAVPEVSTGESHAVPCASAVHAAQNPNPMNGSAGHRDTRYSLTCSVLFAGVLR